MQTLHELWASGLVLWLTYASFKFCCEWLKIWALISRFYCEQEFPFFSSKEVELQANQPHQSRYLNEGPAGRCDLSEHDSAKKNKSCASPPDLRQFPNGRSSKKPSSDSSNMYHVQTVQSKTAVTLRKPRKRPLRDWPLAYFL